MPSTRDFTVASPLGDDVLLLRSMTATEALGRPFEFGLELRSTNYEIAMDAILGENVTVAVDLKGDEKRYFNGYVSRFQQVEGTERHAWYRATLRPWLWFLTRTSDCRIFQDMSVPDIVKKVFRDHGFTDFDEALNGTYPQLEYCVQYRETDFDFVSRLLEREGIYYFFRHENGKHTLVLADSPGSHTEIKGYESIVFLPESAPAPDRPQHVNRWSVAREIQPGACALNDFDFERPKTRLLTRSTADRKHAAADFEMYDYPGIYTQAKDGETRARHRLEEWQARFERIEGGGDARGLHPGGLFSLTGHPREDQNRKCLVVAATHEFRSPEFHEGDADEPVYTNTFVAVDATCPYRSPRTTPRPVVQGPQTAMVVGKQGEEIWTDRYGRVKVQFHWDREGQADEKSSCWVRVAQAWAGKGWGAIQLPRIGQEVVVDFLEGDPDRPLITGRVYNGQAMPPWDLPAHATMSGVKSSSSTGGGGFNEVHFEDKKGEEKIFVHAQNNLDVRVRNDRFETVSNNRHLHVEKDKFERIDNNRNETVDADHKEKIKKDRHLDVLGKEAKSVGKSLSLTVKGEVIEVFKADNSRQVTGDCYVKAKNVIIEGMQNITLSVGGSHIAIEPASIEIKSSGEVTVKGTKVGVSGDLQAELKGGAMTQIQGGIVKIN
jgi:type VI secretion system secreted protein VgrG